MTPEDEEFAALEKRLAKPVDDDAIQDYKKPWVGLTTEEILNLGAGVVNFEYAAAIEAKLKEKNT